MATVGVAHEIGVVLEDRQATTQALLTQPLFGIIEQVFENTLTSFVIDHDIRRAGAFWGGVFRMTAGVEVETSPVFQENVEKPLGGDQLFKEVTYCLFRRQRSFAIGGKNNPILALKTVTALLHDPRLAFARSTRRPGAENR